MPSYMRAKSFRRVSSGGDADGQKRNGERTAEKRPESPPKGNHRPDFCGSESDLKEIKRRRKEHLRSLDFPEGLVRTFLDHVDSTACRLWLIDNSEHMSGRDAHLMRQQGDTVEKVNGASRWEESSDCVLFHATFGAECWMPTKYLFLNDPSPNPELQLLGLCQNQPGAAVDRELQTLRTVMSSVVPAGSVPLARRIRSAVNYLKWEAPRFRSANKTATLCLSTQGLPTDKHGKHSKEAFKDFVDSLRLLEGMPVRIVVRLCTDDEKTIYLYDKLEEKLGNMTYDVLDDFWGEALEVYMHNPWVTYGLPLHRMREAGVTSHAIRVDDRALSPQEVHKFCTCLLVGKRDDDIPDPLADWSRFLNSLNALQAREKLQWNPVSKQMTPWVDVNRLHSIFGGQPFAQSIPRSPSTSTQQQPRKPPSSARLGRKYASYTAGDASQQQGGQGRGNGVVYSNGGDNGDVGTLEKRIVKVWAKRPPKFNELRSLGELLQTVQVLTFPPALGVEPHDYFDKWKPLCVTGSNGSVQEEVAKRALRKAKFFLHPDKLPKNLTEKQTLLFKTLWDVFGEAEEKL